MDKYCFNAENYITISDECLNFAWKRVSYSGLLDSSCEM